MDDVRLQASGLWTEPSELSAPPGALREALNVRILRANVIEPRPGFPATVISGSSGAAGAMGSWRDSLYASFGYPSTPEVPSELWRVSGTPAEVVDGASASLELTYHEAQILPMGRCLYVTTDNGVYRIASPGAVLAVRAGIPRGTTPVVTLTSGSGLADNHDVAVRVIFTQTVNDQLLVGAPCAAYTVANATGGAKSVTLVVTLPDDVVAGMSVQVYRTAPVATGTATGDEMALATSVVLTSADITAGYVSLTIMSSASEVLGASLYTNETQEGILQASSRPPLAKCMAWFKGMAFYGDVTPLAGYVLEGQASDALGGIDSGVTGTATSGSPIITGIAPGHGIQVGAYVALDGYAGIADAVWPADSRVISTTATTVTLDKNALSTTTTAFNVFGVVTVGGNGYIRGGVDDITNGQFGGAQGLVTLLDQQGDVSLDLSGYATSVPYLTWTSESAFTVSYVGSSFTTWAGLYNSTPVAAVLGSTKAAPARIAYSKLDQPEAVPLTHFVDIGDYQEPVMGLAATRDSLFVLKTDGVWRITGESPETLRVEEYDRSLHIIGRRAYDTFENAVWLWTTQGVVSLTEAGVQRRSDPAIRTDLEVYQDLVESELADGTPVNACFVTGCTSQACVLVGVPDAANTDNVDYLYVSEGATGAWVRWEPSAHAWSAAIEHEGRIVIGGEEQVHYQADELVDVSEAVDVTVITALSVTIPGFNSLNAIGSRVTQGEAEAWLSDYVNSAMVTTTELDDGPATLAHPITTTVQWVSAPSAGGLVHWRQLRAMFARLAGAVYVLFRYTTERVPTAGSVVHAVADPSEALSPTSLRNTITRAHARAARLRPTMFIRSAAQSWLLDGVTITGEPMRGGERMP